jgi:hypothetical protein
MVDDGGVRLSVSEALATENYHKTELVLCAARLDLLLRIRKGKGIDSPRVLLDFAFPCMRE